MIVESGMGKNEKEGWRGDGGRKREKEG